MRNGKLRIAVFGDSVPWGQGLLEQDKYRTLVAEGLAARPGSAPQEPPAVLAHSGATIGVGVNTNEGSLDGEVPTAYPTIIQQVAAFNDAPESVDLVLLNGGINDVDIRDILNPLTDSSHLADWTETHCHLHMKALLDAVTAKFTLATARIIVTGYYQILSEQSDPDLFKPFLKAVGAPWLDFLVDDFEDEIIKKIVKNCKVFADQSATALQNAVNDSNAGAGGGRVTFVSSGFGPQNAAFAPDHWIFGVDGTDLSPEDEVIAARHASCDRCETDVLQRWECYRASAGHPNQDGAKQYAAQILAMV